MEIGGRVHHARFGEGRVLRVLEGGERFLVQFADRASVPWMVTRGELGLPVVHLDSKPVEETPLSEQEARQALEALRLGVVPAQGLKRLTVGRERELLRCGEVLARGRGMQVVLGGYGAGKSHLLSVVEQMAIEAGFAVASAAFDPEELPPSHPLRLYAALLRTLRLPGRGQDGLAGALGPLTGSSRHLSGDRQDRWFSPLLFALGAGPPDLSADMLDFVSGQSHWEPASLAQRLRKAGWKGERPLGLPDYRTFGQIMAHLLATLALWLADAGYKGLVVILDEAEFLDRIGAEGKVFATEVLRYLALVSLPAEALAFDPARLHRGGHPAHQAVNPLPSEDIPLAVFAGLSPAPGVVDALDRVLADPNCRMELDLLRTGLLPQLAARVTTLVRLARPTLSPAAADLELIEAGLKRAFLAGQVQTPREAARLIVEFWDIFVRDPPSARRALGII
jgi:hypothetical protein